MKVGRNDPCPCGSGRKFKKCCADSGVSAAALNLPHTRADRTSAFAKLHFFVDELWGKEEEIGFDEFWGRHLERESELPEELLVMQH